VLAHRLRALWIALLALAGASTGGVARADDSLTLAGRWSASPLTVKWIIGDWGPACGPRPSGGGEPAASVNIVADGGELSINGGGRSYSTTTCWEQYPGIQRTGHAASARSWKTTCHTGQGDPRQAGLTTSLTATDGTISFYEAGQYQFVIQGQNCTASVGRYRTYNLLQRAGAPPPVLPPPSATAPPAPSASKPRETTNSRCASPGPPARLEVRPARKLVRAGEEFTFRAIVSDAAGCPVYQRPTWALENGADQADLTGQGTIKVHANAPEGELRLTASVGGRSALVTVEVASSARYDKLLQSGAFNSQGEVDEAASVAIASQSIGAASAVAEDHATNRKWIFVGLVGVIALVLAIAGFLLFRRGRRTRALELEKDAARRTEVGSATATAFAGPRPGEMTVAVAPPTTELVADLAAEPPPRTPRVPRTICPVCGQQYPPESRFCGKDGATLLPLN
jgi:hypothetical protein